MSDFIPAFTEKCKKSVEHFKDELQKLRTGRANAGVLEGLTVEYYGSQVPLQQMGLLSTPEPRLITVQVYDASAVDAVEKAIRSSDLGFNPARDGNLIRIAVPALTEERRKEIVKTMHRLAEDARVALRSLRRDEIDNLKKQEKKKDISEDDLRRGQDSIQKVTDTYVAEVDKLLTAKEKDVLAV